MSIPNLYPCSTAFDTEIKWLFRVGTYATFWISIRRDSTPEKKSIPRSPRPLISWTSPPPISTLPLQGVKLVILSRLGVIMPEAPVSKYQPSNPSPARNANPTTPPIGSPSPHLPCRCPHPAGSSSNVRNPASAALDVVDPESESGVSIATLACISAGDGHLSSSCPLPWHLLHSFTVQSRAKWPLPRQL